MRKSKSIHFKLRTKVRAWILPFYDITGSIIMDKWSTDSVRKFMLGGPTCKQLGEMFAGHMSANVAE